MRLISLCGWMFWLEMGFVLDFLLVHVHGGNGLVRIVVVNTLFAIGTDLRQSLRLRV